MPHYVYKNINAAFRGMLETVLDSKVNMMGSDNDSLFSRTSSRNGDVIRWRRPVIIEYTNPRERVLFNQARDTNPAFHLYESLWMLAGRNDLAPLQYYVSTFDNYSDDGVTLNGAYGHRWRHAVTSPKFGDWKKGDNVCPECSMGDGGVTDQLKIIIDHLKHNPTSRRAVLHMSNVEDDLLKIDTTKDQCCNLAITLEIESRFRAGGGRSTSGLEEKLNMTVFNRSNDLILGALGANVCHFSILMEYLAAHIGVEVGTYCQVSSNMHVYTDPKLWKPEKWLADTTPDFYQEQGVHSSFKTAKPFPLVKDPTRFDSEVVEFVELHKEIADDNGGRWTEPFLRNVARPMLLAFHWHKRRDYKTALRALEMCEADDWRVVGQNWLRKRKTMWESKNAIPTNQSQES